MQPYEDLLRQRNWPAFWIVDESARVVLRLPGSEDLPQEIRDAVLELQREGRESEDPNLPFARLLHGGVLLRIAALEGAPGPLTAVFVERFETRNQIAEGSRKYGLTNRERDVLAHVVEGDRTAEIAEKLGIARSTVTLHVKSMMAKTASRTRVEMLVRIFAHDGDRRPPARTYHGEIKPDQS